MKGWFLGLALKPFIGIAVLAVLYFGARYVATALHWLMPNGRVKEYLFRGWQGRGARPATDPNKRLLK
jgi:hypothetical protein